MAKLLIQGVICAQRRQRVVSPLPPSILEADIREVSCKAGPPSTLETNTGIPGPLHFRDTPSFSDQKGQGLCVSASSSEEAGILAGTGGKEVLNKVSEMACLAAPETPPANKTSLQRIQCHPGC